MASNRFLEIGHFNYRSGGDCSAHEHTPETAAPGAQSPELPAEGQLASSLEGGWPTGSPRTAQRLPQAHQILDVILADVKLSAKKTCGLGHPRLQCLKHRPPSRGAMPNTRRRRVKGNGRNLTFFCICWQASPETGTCEAQWPHHTPATEAWQATIPLQG